MKDTRLLIDTSISPQPQRSQLAGLRNLTFFNAVNIDTVTVLWYWRYDYQNNNANINKKTE